jgi:hypothetical protein
MSIGILCSMRLPGTITAHDRQRRNRRIYSESLSDAPLRGGFISIAK